MEPDDRTLLILDLDETLIYAASEPLLRQPDFCVGPYCAYCRPHLDEFLQGCAGLYRLAFFSSSGDSYAEAVVRHILPPGQKPAFVWGRSRCVRRYDPELQEEYFLKDLKKVKRLGFDLRRVLIVDDTPRKVSRHYGNAVYIRAYTGQEADEELRLLGRYLASIHATPNLRRLEKRNWRQQTQLPEDRYGPGE